MLVKSSHFPTPAFLPVFISVVIKSLQSACSQPLSSGAGKKSGGLEWSQKSLRLEPHSEAADAALVNATVLSVAICLLPLGASRTRRYVGIYPDISAGLKVCTRVTDNDWV